jgi:hypothetical protein
MKKKICTKFMLPAEETWKMKTQRGQERVKPVAVLDYSFITGACRLEGPSLRDATQRRKN